MLETLDAPAVRAWGLAAALALEQRRHEIDELNVFPIADADTGTNLAMTVRAGADAANRDDSADAATALAALARGAVLGARGNSGVIISQLLRGLADGVAGDPGCDGVRLQGALHSAAALAYASVSQPQEGTILSVARAAAVAAQQLAGDAADLGSVIAAALDGAVAALVRTPEQLPVLARAGVVDAGGRGLVVMLDALCVVVTGAPSVLEAIPRTPRTRRVLEAVRETGSETFGYEVQYLLDAPDDAVQRLRAGLTTIGDSVAVVGTGHGVWNVHVHANDVGAALEAGVEAGRPHRITVVRFADQIADQLADRIGAQGAADPWTDPTTDPVTDSMGDPHPEAGVTGTVVVIALVQTRGLAHLFEGEGVIVIVVDDPERGERAALTALRAAGATGALRVVLLPNEPSLGTVAARAAHRARAEGVEVAVVPTRSPVQGLAAVAVHDPRRRAEDDVIAMAEAAAATRFAEVSVAELAGLTTIGACQAGDVLGLIDGDVVEIGSSVPDVSFLLLNRLLGTGGELITVVIGPDAPIDTDKAIRRHVADRSPLTEVVSYAGEQDSCLLLMGME
jgi:DAK2 domain fusion protein YloV